MAHDIFDFNEGWEQNDKAHGGEIIDLERDAEKQRQELLAQQWRDGELFVTTDYVSVYENPTDPSPVVSEFEPDTVILLSSLHDSTNYGGFRDLLLPIRGWVWTSVDEYDKAFHDASMMLRNVQTRETSTSLYRIAKYAKRKLRKKSKKKVKAKAAPNTAASTGQIDIPYTSHTANTSDEHGDDFAHIAQTESDPNIFNQANPDHTRHKTNHLYVSDKQRQQKKKSNITINMSAHKVPSTSNIDIDTPIGINSDTGNTNISPMYDIAMTPPPSKSRVRVIGQSDPHSVQSSREFSESREFSSKFRRMSHQVRYQPAAIQKIERPLSLEELDKLRAEQLDVEHLQTDSAGHIVIEKELQKKITEHKLTEDALTNIEAKEQESFGSKIVNSTYVRKLVHFVRSHPALLTLVYIIFTGFVEFLIFFDIVTDVIIAGGLSTSTYQAFFTLAAALIITPYFIAWSSVWGLIEKKREQVGKKDSKHIIFKNQRRYRIFVTLFSFAPCGVIILILFDVWIVFEFIIIRPLYFLCRFKLFRTDTFEELGYRKLRRVSEVCSETLFQAIIQLLLLLLLRHKDVDKNDRNQNSVGSITTFDVVLSLLASFFVMFLWFGIILRFEASSNGISVIEYLPIVLQGSFKFVPFLPAIEKGTKNGLKVNWCLFKFDLNALTALGQSLGAPFCNLQLIKASTKTFKKLPRFGCKLFGRIINTALQSPITVIISRLDTDMEELFELFDTANTKYFNFINFCRATLALRAQDKEVLKYQEISEIFYELAGNKNYEPDPENIDEDKQQKVWLLDLMLKFRTSKKYISILDIQQPEDYCVKKHDVNLLTFVRSMGFQSDNHEQNVILAVCQNNLQIAHVLTEDDGIPVVVEITEGRELLASYMNFHRPNKNDQRGEAGGEEEKGNNMVRVQQYHELNRLRQDGNINQGLSALDAFDAIFSDVSIYVSAAMCEIEKTTSTTKETINQFWNEKLLFIIPYSVIDEIRDDATHTLVRDTEHRAHNPYGTSVYGASGLLHDVVLHDVAFPPIKTPYNENSPSMKSTADYDNILLDKDKSHKRTVQFSIDGENAQNEDEDEDVAVAQTIKCHETTGTVHIKTSLERHSVDSDDGEEEEISDAENDDDQVPALGHHTGLTENFENMFQVKVKAKSNSNVNSLHSVPSDSPQVSSYDVSNIDYAVAADANASNANLPTTHIGAPINTHIKTASSFDPNLFGNGLIGGRGHTHSHTNFRGRESALRDSLHFNKFSRQPSIRPGALIPHFEKKIYLDLHLFDDSFIQRRESQLDKELDFDFAPTQSMGSVTKRSKKKYRRTGSGLTKKVARNLLKKSKSISYNEAHEHDDSDGFNSDSEAKNDPFGVCTPRSTTGTTAYNESSGIEGAEGTFLGSAHISINIDDPDALAQYHTKTKEKEVKIGKKSLNSAKESKLKFKVYCNALSAYLKHGKNYGDRLRELEIVENAEREKIA